MNIKPRLALVPLVVVGLFGCATTDDRAMSSAPASAAASEPDDAYVAYVERTARRRGLEVVWVNIPRKKVEVAAPPQE